MWLMLRRKQRLAKFATQLPDALELISRALRAGHSLGIRHEPGGATRCQPPIAQEFNRVFEAQNLGIPLDDALRVADAIACPTWT